MNWIFFFYHLLKSLFVTDVCRSFHSIIIQYFPFFYLQRSCFGEFLVLGPAGRSVPPASEIRSIRLHPCQQKRQLDFSGQENLLHDRTTVNIHTTRTHNIIEVRSGLSHPIYAQFLRVHHRSHRTISRLAWLLSDR